MDGNGEEPETIDVWELMRDLDDDEEEDPLHSIASSSKQVATSAKFSPDSFALEPSDVKVEVAQCLSSFQTHSIPGRSFVGPAQGSSRDLPTYGKARSKHASVGGLTLHTSDLSNVKLAGPTQETLAEHLQRSLSFETSPKKEMRRIFGQKDAMNAYYNKGLKLGFDKDASSFSSNQLPWEARESVSSPSTPSFSEPVSLKKCFQEDAHRLKQRHEHRASLEVPGHIKAQSKLPPHQASHPQLVRASKVLGQTSKVPVSSHNMRSYVGSNVDVGANHKAPSHHVVAKKMPYVGLSQARELSQQGRVRSLRHSFTVGNRSKEPSEMRNFSVNNRSSSLEFEKGAAAPKVRVVLYSTSSKEDVQAFEDSNAARAVLKSMVGTTFEERIISQHAEYEQELRRALNTESALVPTVCVKGRYITGLDDIMQMYKKGVLRALVAESLAQELKPDAPCICRGGKFLICPACKGKRKLARKEGDDDVVCRHCSATGLIKCPNCINV
ncbi:hypothetical protein GOP47_0000997 [Adiantum capillus-veneris]|uniref:Glutaredoxin domain-containing protein n=1 Tax=Adiantum capillus-veneris TaxID=13818 RepID=A0A9D4VG10_ADICA|nr:hypothetical protein GOP47_0000997 [Adiantum capillus-veneris]